MTKNSNSGVHGVECLWDRSTVRFVLVQYSFDSAFQCDEDRPLISRVLSQPYQCRKNFNLKSPQVYFVCTTARRQGKARQGCATLLEYYGQIPFSIFTFSFFVFFFCRCLDVFSHILINSLFTIGDFVFAKIQFKKLPTIMFKNRVGTSSVFS